MSPASVMVVTRDSDKRPSWIPVVEKPLGPDLWTFAPLSEAIRPLLSRHFKPALLARMTIVPFYLLDQSFMKQIVTLRLNKLADRLFESHKMQLSYSDTLLDCIAERCTEVETGARNIDHIMRGTILPRLSEKILTQMGTGEMPAAVRLGVTKGGEFSIDFGETAAAVKPRKKSTGRAKQTAPGIVK